MVEKTIQLDNISLVDFLGIKNKNINEIASAFPSSKIIARGDEIRLKGNHSELLKINELFNQLIDHYNRFGGITEDVIKQYLAQEEITSTVNGDDVILYGTKGNLIKPKSINQQKLVGLVKKKDLVFALGPAGTGKTYISVALAVTALKNKEVKKIIITRPAVEAGENLGFLPGDLKEKIDPYLRPIYDALDDMVPHERLKYYEENRIIEIAPLAYMRGRTLNNAFILLDEAQNTTPMQIKMFLTRMGPNSKVIVTGDTTQVDLPKNQESGLRHALRVLQNVEGIGFLQLNTHDVIRHKIVKDIIAAYDNNKDPEER